MPTIPRRSVLYLPGSNARALEKARSLPCDAVILDLEDAVSPGAKEDAREQVRNAVIMRGYGPREVIARVNALDTPWGDGDVEAVAGLPVDGVLFPKITGPDDVTDAVAALDDAGANPATAVWIMAETPQAVLHLPQILQASSRVRVVVAGTADLARALRVPDRPGRPGLIPHLAHCVAAARAAGVEILDGVHENVEDAAGLQQACQSGRDLGFDGKTLIHPGQIQAANDAFSPGDEAVERALAVIQAWNEAEESGHGVAVLAGRMIERLHVDEARRLIALDRAIRDREARLDVPAAGSP